MIKATILQLKGRNIGYVIKNHGDPVVCAAVSMLAINTINSIKAFTPLKDSEFILKSDEKGGFIAFSLKGLHSRTSGAGILLDALALGLKDVQAQHPKDLKLAIRKVM